MLTYESYFEMLPEEIVDFWKSQIWVKHAVQRGRSAAEAFADLQAVYEADAELSPFERESLRLVVDQAASSPFHIESLLERAGTRLTGAEVEIGLIGLRRKGIICTFRKMWGDLLFALPWDGFRVWREVLDPNRLPEESDRESPHIEESPPVSAGLVQDLFILLVIAAKEDVPATSKGALTKRHIDRFAQAVKLSREPLAECGLHYALCDVYDPGLAVVLDMAMRLGLIEERGGVYRVQTDHLSDWLSLGADGQQAILYKCWRELQLPDEVWFQHAVAYMECMKPGILFTAEALAQKSAFLEAQSGKSVTDLAEKLHKQWCSPLMALGLLEGMPSENGQLQYRLRYDVSPHFDHQPHRIGEQGGSLYVQPDFEMIVPPTAPLAVCWESALLGDGIEWNDDCMRIMITKQSFFAACRRGQTTESILQFLTEHALYGVPDNVADAIRSWGAGFGKARIAESILLYCADAVTADAVADSHRCSAYLLSRIAPEVFVVKRDEVNSLKKELEKIGIVPIIPSTNQSDFNQTEMQRAEHLQAVSPAAARKQFTQAAIQRKALIIGRNAAIHFQPEARLPDYEDAYEGLGDVPSLWFSEYRTYHASTRKEIIRKAIEWRSYVKLRKNGAERTVIPRTLREIGEGWSVMGYERAVEDARDPIREVQVKWDEWEEMRLILPGKEVMTNGTL